MQNLQVLAYYGKYMQQGHCKTKCYLKYEYAIYIFKNNNTVNFSKYFYIQIFQNKTKIQKPYTWPHKNIQFSIEKTLFEAKHFFFQIKLYLSIK